MYFLNDNVSLVLDCVYICWWMLFLCFIVYVLSVTHMLYGYRVFFFVILYEYRFVIRGSNVSSPSLTLISIVNIYAVSMTILYCLLLCGIHLESLTVLPRT